MKAAKCFTETTQINAMNSFSAHSLALCFRRVWKKRPVLPVFPADGAASSASGWKVAEEKTIEGVRALKHGANENSAHRL